MPGQFDVFPSYKGGHTTTYGGYVWELCPSHRFANHWGFVAQHRLIGEDLVGRPLRDNEVVHHHDQNRTNNDPSNLAVMTREAHRSHHARLVAEMTKSPIDRDELIKALEECGSIKGAARKLGVHHMTIRNRFPELLHPYKRVTPTNLDDPRDIEIVLAAAPDPNIGLTELRKKVHMSAATILRICKRNGVEWVKKKRDDKPRMTYCGKPTSRMLAEARENNSEPESQLADHQ